MNTRTFNKDKVSTIILENKAILVFLIIILVAIPLTQGTMLESVNISSISRQLVATTVLALGTTVIIAVGGVDLSAGQAMNLVGIIYGLASLRMPLVLALMVAILAGMLCGFLNSSITYRFKLPPFILTLATAQVFKGIAYLLVDGASVSNLNNEVKFIGQGFVFGFLPVSVFIMIVLIIVIYIVMNRTKYGRHVIATGGNENAARVSGINVNRVKIIAYVLSGLFISISAIILTGRIGTALPNAADGMEMDAIAAVVIGGTPMSGGKANIVGTLFGCLIIVVIGNVLNLLGVSSFWQYIAKGVIIVFAIILDSRAEAFLNRKKQSI